MFTVKDAYFKGATNLKSDSYNKTEQEAQKRAFAMFLRKRELIVAKLNAIKKRYNLTDADLDKMGLYPHKLLDPIMKKEDLQYSGGKGGPGLPISPDEITTGLTFIGRLLGWLRAEPNAGQAQRYGGMQGVIDAEAELDNVERKVSDPNVEEKYNLDNYREDFRQRWVGRTPAEQRIHERELKEAKEAEDLRQARLNRTPAEQQQYENNMFSIEDTPEDYMPGAQEEFERLDRERIAGTSPVEVPDQSEEARFFDRLKLIRGMKINPDKVAKGGVKSSPDRVTRSPAEQLVSSRNVIRFLNLIAHNGEGATRANDAIRLFSTNDIHTSNQKKILEAVWKTMDYNVRQDVLDTFTRYGLNLHTEYYDKSVKNDQIMQTFRSNMAHDFQDGLTPLEREANVIGRLREIFTQQLQRLPDNTEIKGTKLGTSTHKFTVGDLKTKLNRGTSTVRPIQEVESPEMQEIPMEDINSQFDVLGREMKQADIGLEHIEAIRELLTTGFRRNVMQRYTNHGVWDLAVGGAWADTSAMLTKIINDIRKTNSGVRYNLGNLEDFLNVLAKNLRGIHSESLRNTYLKARSDISSQVPNESEVRRPFWMNNEMRAISDMTNIPLDYPPEGELLTTQSMVHSLARGARPAGEVISVRVEGLPRVGIGVARQSLDERRNIILNMNTADFDDLLASGNPRFMLEEIMRWRNAPRADVVDEILNRIPETTPIRNPDDPGDDPNRITITIGSTRRKIKLSVWIALLIALGYGVKKIVDHIKKLKSGKKEDTIDIPTEKPKPDDPTTPPDMPSGETGDLPNIPPGDVQLPYIPPRRPIIDYGDDPDVTIPVNSRESLDYTNMSKNFLENPMNPVFGWNDIKVLDPDPVLGADHMDFSFIPDTPENKILLDNIHKYNTMAFDYNKNIRDYEIYKVTGGHPGNSVWGLWSDKEAAAVNPNLAIAMKKTTSQIQQDVATISQSMFGKAGSPSPTENSPATLSTYEFKRYANGALTKYSEMKKSALSRQLGMDSKIDEYNSAVKDYNKKVDEASVKDPSGAGNAPDQPDNKILRTYLDEMNKSIGTEGKKASRIGRVESRKIQYSDLDKSAIDKVIATETDPTSTRAIPLTPEEETSIRDNPELYERIMEFKRLSPLAKTPKDFTKLVELQKYFDQIKRNDYKPVSYVTPVSGEYKVELDPQKRAVYDQSKTTYQMAQARLQQAISSGASSHQINMMYQDLDNKKAFYEASRSAYQENLEQARTSSTADTTYLSDMGREIIPRTADERKLFDRMQNVESVLQTNPQALQMYNEKVNTIGKNQNPVDVYAKRIKYLSDISTQFGLARDYARALNEPISASVADAYGDDNTTVQLPEEEDTNDLVNRPETIDPAEAKLFLSSRAEQIAEQKRWAEFSNVQPFNGLGNTKTNPLLREQVRTYMNRFSDTTKGEYPSRDDMRILARDKVIRRSQLMPSASNFPMIPEIQVAFGPEHFENEFSIPQMQGAGAFTISDSDLPNNKYSTWFRPSVFHPDYQLMTYNKDLSASGKMTGPYARDAKYSYTSKGMRPQYYIQETLENMGDTMSDNYGSRRNFNNTINYNNMNRPGSEPATTFTLYDEATVKKIGSRRRR